MFWNNISEVRDICLNNRILRGATGISCLSNNIFPMFIGDPYTSSKIKSIDIDQNGNIIYCLETTSNTILFNSNSQNFAAFIDGTNF